MMEFEEMRKIWDEQKGETMYAINEAALHKSVMRKKDSASKRINHTEIRLSLINGLVAMILLIFAINGNKWAYLTSGLFAGTVVYIQYFRWKRKKAENTFDRSMLGELDHAISNANFIIRFNYFMIVGYLVPFAVINIVQMIIREASWQEWVFIMGAILLSYILIRREQRVCNLPRRKQLLTLKDKLMEQ